MVEFRTAIVANAVGSTIDREHAAEPFVAASEQIVRDILQEMRHTRTSKGDASLQPASIEGRIEHESKALANSGPGVG